MKHFLLIPEWLRINMNIILSQLMIIIMITGISYAGTDVAQNALERDITLSIENTDLVTVLKRIEQKASVRFVYSKSFIQLDQNVSVTATNEKLDKVLMRLFNPLHISYEAVKDRIILKRAENRKASQDAPQPDHAYQHDAAADFHVQGKVTAETGEPLPGVNVLVKGTTNGTVTDVQGNYQINVTSGGETLLFSFIGYLTQEVAVNNRSVVDVQMAADVKALEEVIVVGYGETKKLTLTGSVASVKGKDVVQSPATNVSNSLVGRMPGLVAITPSGEPGYDGSTLRIRGVNSLGNNEPLVVVDGIPGRSLERLDPNSIESVTILRDASAAIYGSQAANGVILVTTKRGKLGKPEVTFNYNQGFGKPTRVPEMANAPQYATMLNEIDIYRGRTPRYTDEDIQKFSDGSDPWKYPDTDWYKEVLRPWSGQGYANVQVAGGSDKMKYFLLLGGKTQDGYYKKSATKYSQYDFRSNLDGRLSDYVRIGFDLAGRLEDRNFPTRSAGSIFRMVMRGKPILPAYWPNGLPGPDIEYGDNPVVVSTDATGYDRDKWYILQSNLQLSVDIPWVKGLSVVTNASIDKGFRFHKRFETPWYLYSWDYQTYDTDGNPVLVKGKKGFDDPRLTEEMEDNQNILINSRVNYEFTLGGSHNVKLMAGIERRTGNGDRFNAYRRYFVSTAIDQLFAGGDEAKNNGGSAFQSARLNYFGRVNYNYKERYLAEFVWRYDGSYIFPAAGRFGFFPGISAGWRISEESFWNTPLINNLKLRASWGQTGNDRIDEWQYLSSYTFGRWETGPESTEAYIFGLTKENKTLYETRIPNKNVTWEVANQLDIGFDLSLFQSRLTLEADYFNNKRTNILWRRNASIPLSTGLSLPRENIGEVVNRGFDFMIGYSGEAGKVHYDVAFNGGYQRNKITFWDEAPGAPSYQRSTGHAIPTDPNVPNNNLFYQAIGIFDSDAEVAGYPHWDGARAGDVIFRDVDGNNKIDGNDRVRYDKTNIPRLTTGLSINLQYNHFDLAILFQGAAGAVQYIDTESGEIGNFLKDYYDNRWTAERPNASYPRTFNRTDEYWRNQRNTFWLRKTDYVRLKNIQLGYAFPNELVQHIGMQSLRVYVSGLNLFTWSPDFKDFDPELGSSSGQGYPLQKVINAGITLTF